MDFIRKIFTSEEKFDHRFHLHNDPYGDILVTHNFYELHNLIKLGYEIIHIINEYYSDIEKFREVLLPNEDKINSDIFQITCISFST